MRLVLINVLVFLFLMPASVEGIALESSTLSAPYAFSAEERAASVPLRFAALSERKEQAADSIAAYQALLTPRCKRDLCIHKMVRSVEPFEILKNGTLRRYEISSVEQNCADENRADCKRPSPSEFANFTQSFAFCSATNPTIVSTATEATKSSYYIATLLNFGKGMRTYQVDAVLEYLVACHGWEPRQFDERYRTIIAARGYQSAEEKPASPQKRFSSESDALSFLRAQDVGGSIATLPSI